jgi:hypothetical protein
LGEIVGVPVGVAGVGDVGILDLPGGGGCEEVELADPGRTAGFESAIDGFTSSAYPRWESKKQSISTRCPSIDWNSRISSTPKLVRTHPSRGNGMPLTPRNGRTGLLAQRPSRAKRCAQHDGRQRMVELDVEVCWSDFHLAGPREVG